MQKVFKIILINGTYTIGDRNPSQRCPQSRLKFVPGSLKIKANSCILEVTAKAIAVKMQQVFKIISINGTYTIGERNPVEGGHNPGRTSFQASIKSENCPTIKGTRKETIVKRKQA